MLKTNLLEVSSAASPTVDTGSFRDRDGRIYRSEGRIFRGVSAAALTDFEKLKSTVFYQKFLDKGQLVGTELVAADSVPLPAQIKGQWAGFLEHERVPVISYPYEWTFGMLRDAAILQLDLVEAAILEGMTMKDATPYNIQFVAGKPVFIDIPSFESLPAGMPWVGYRQFCEMFLFPLMLQAYKGIDFQAMMRANIDGIGVQTASRLFSFRDRFRSGVLTHVWLQAKLDRRYGNTQKNIRSDLKSAGFNREMILANVRKLRKLSGRLSWQGEGSEWGSYDAFHNYSESDHQLKEAFINDSVADSQAHTVWDIGCNTGQFSKIAAQHASSVVAMDLDHFAVERLYRETREAKLSKILPLVQNIADPSPNWGWRNRERVDLATRAQPDLLLCLALIHHVVISANVPMAEFVDALSDLSDQLVIEYVSRSDDKVKALLRNKEDKYSDYSREGLESELSKHYEIARRQELESGNRYLYWCRRKVSTA